MLDNIIKKLAIILTLCGGIALVLYFTDLGAILKGEAKKKVEKKVEKKQQPYNSNNYPLAHLYNPHLRNQNNYF